jgi:hypothetical protein
MSVWHDAKDIPDKNMYVPKKTVDIREGTMDVWG